MSFSYAPKSILTGHTTPLLRHFTFTLRHYVRLCYIIQPPLACLIFPSTLIHGRAKCRKFNKNLRVNEMDKSCEQYSAEKESIIHNTLQTATKYIYIENVNLQSSKQ